MTSVLNDRQKNWFDLIQVKRGGKESIEDFLVKFNKIMNIFKVSPKIQVIFYLKALDLSDENLCQLLKFVDCTDTTVGEINKCLKIQLVNIKQEITQDKNGLQDSPTLSNLNSGPLYKNNSCSDTFEGTDKKDSSNNKKRVRSRSNSEGRVRSRRFINEEECLQDATQKKIMQEEIEDLKQKVHFLNRKKEEFIERYEKDLKRKKEELEEEKRKRRKLQDNVKSFSNGRPVSPNRNVGGETRVILNGKRSLTVRPPRTKSERHSSPRRRSESKVGTSSGQSGERSKASRFSTNQSSTAARFHSPHRRLRSRSKTLSVSRKHSPRLSGLKSPASRDCSISSKTSTREFSIHRRSSPVRKHSRPRISSPRRTSSRKPSHSRLKSKRHEKRDRARGWGRSASPKRAKTLSRVL